jgi:hypothetical protein
MLVHSSETSNIRFWIEALAGCMTGMPSSHTQNLLYAHEEIVVYSFIYTDVSDRI